MKGGSLSLHLLPPPSQGLALLLSRRTADPTEPQNPEGGPLRGGGLPCSPQLGTFLFHCYNLLQVIALPLHW